jgi:hypothetical protein
MVRTYAAASARSAHRKNAQWLTIPAAWIPSCLAVGLLTALACGKPAAPTRIAAGDVPSAAELEAFVSHAGNVRLTMTEQEVRSALGTKPTRRQEAMSSDGESVVVWDTITGPHPGAALGRFVAGRLRQIEFATASTAMPRIGRDVAASLESAETVRRSVAGTLRIADIEAATGSRGLRARWTFTHWPPDRAKITSVWLWEIEPGGRVLMVDEYDGLAGQPVVRDLK